MIFVSLTTNEEYKNIQQPRRRMNSKKATIRFSYQQQPRTRINNDNNAIIVHNFIRLNTMNNDLSLLYN